MSGKQYTARLVLTLQACPSSFSALWASARFWMTRPPAFPEKSMATRLVSDVDYRQTVETNVNEDFSYRLRPSYFGQSSFFQSRQCHRSWVGQLVVTLKLLPILTTHKHTVCKFWLFIITLHFEKGSILKTLNSLKAEVQHLRVCSFSAHITFRSWERTWLLEDLKHRRPNMRPLKISFKKSMIVLIFLNTFVLCTCQVLFGLLPVCEFSCCSLEQGCQTQIPSWPKFKIGTKSQANTDIYWKKILLFFFVGFLGSWQATNWCIFTINWCGVWILTLTLT